MQSNAELNVWKKILTAKHIPISFLTSLEIFLRSKE